MKKTLMMAFVVPFLAVGVAQAQDISIHDAYAFAAKQSMPASAIFMTLDNTGEGDDRMIGFKSEVADRIELHTMAMDGDVMKMRQVKGFDVPAGGSHILKPMDDHVMLYELTGDLVDGEGFDGVAVFEKAGEIPVSVTIRNRADVMGDAEKMKDHGHSKGH